MDNNNHNHRRVPPDKRKRTETSCDKCKSRKQKCDRLPGKGQCRYCEIHGIACSITQPRKRRAYGSIEGVGSRLALLESLVKGLLPEADLSTNDEMQRLGQSLGIPLPPVEDSNALGRGHRSDDKRDNESALPLLPDQQGQVQYIGPASSFSFHLKLRRLIGNYSIFEFAMFGRNAADQDDAPPTPSLPRMSDGSNPRDYRALSNASSDCGSPSDAVREIDSQILDLLIDAYFEVVHSDFPVVHEASFREAYEVWSVSPATSTSTANPAWLCTLLCVLILASRVAPIAISEEMGRKWWRHVQKLLPTVFFTSNHFAVQALMLAALHLHNDSHRDACWNITGTAVRIAFAIGLHRDDVKHVQSPLGRELRKQLWWTLYAFEQMQVSSYDRPTAIDHTVTCVSCPNERIVGVAGHCPQDYMKWSQRLVILLGSACKALNIAGSGYASTEDAYTRPLSPAAGILRDLIRWKDDLPRHLRLDSIDSLAPSSQRPLLLLHAQFHYTVVLMSRSALLRRATVLSKNSDEAIPETLLNVSATCVTSGRSLGRLLRKLDTIDKFNPFTWWDIFYTVASALILVLDISCAVKQQNKNGAVESQSTLRELSTLMVKQLQRPRVPDSMQKWATIVIDVCSLAEQLIATNQVPANHISTQTASDHSRSSAAPTIPDTPEDQQVPTVYGANRNVVQQYAEVSPNETFSFEDFDLARENAQQFWAQLSSMDNLNGQAHDWSWDDIDAVLRGRLSTEQDGLDARRRML